MNPQEIGSSSIFIKGWVETGQGSRWASCRSPTLPPLLQILSPSPTPRSIADHLQLPPLPLCLHLKWVMSIFFPNLPPHSPFCLSPPTPADIPRDLPSLPEKQEDEIQIFTLLPFLHIQSQSHLQLSSRLPAVALPHSLPHSQRPKEILVEHPTFLPTVDLLTTNNPNPFPLLNVSSPDVGVTTQHLETHST